MAGTLSFQTSDSMGNEFSQGQTTDATAFTLSSFTPDEKEAGKLQINYNGVNSATGAAADRYKIARYKKVSGAVTIIGLTAVYSNNDTGMTSVDVTVIASGGTVQVNVTGLAATTITHTMTITRLSSALRQ